ncbi:MAG: hypothetical protein HY329_15475 [Chloroflexi bacterium]|nr:hypothetical protein [Chloroflexota bacterium]
MAAEPGPFGLPTTEHFEGALREAEFGKVELVARELTIKLADFAAYWEAQPCAESSRRASGTAATKRKPRFSRHSARIAVVKEPSFRPKPYLGAPGSNRDQLEVLVKHLVRALWTFAMMTVLLIASGLPMATVVADPEYVEVTHLLASQADVDFGIPPQPVTSGALTPPTNLIASGTQPWITFEWSPTNQEAEYVLIVGTTPQFQATHAGTTWRAYYVGRATRIDWPTSDLSYQVSFENRLYWRVIAGRGQDLAFSAVAVR